MKLSSVAALALLAAAPAFAGTITIDFEGPESFQSVGNYYRDTTGVTFGGAVLGLHNDDLGPYFSNAPSPLGVMFVAGPLSTADTAMNVDGGFSALSFYYSSTEDVIDAVQVWSGVDGTGERLVSLRLTANTSGIWGNWDLVDASGWNGLAHSVVFNVGTFTAFDNVSVVPEPATALLAGLGLFAAFASRRRAA